MSDDRRAIVPTQPAAMQIADPGLQDFATKLKLLLPSGAKLTDNEALAGAQYAKTTGLDPFRGEFYIVPGVGVVPGYKGAITRAGQQGREPDVRYRPLTEAEVDWHDVQPGDKAVICYAIDPAEAVEARQAGREPRVWEGVGIVRKHEMWKSEEWATSQNGKNFKRRLPEAQWKEREDPPKGRSWGWVAQNRAMKDVYNHMGIAVEMDAETILAQAQAAGIPIEELPEGAHLDAEQAQSHVRDALARARRDVELTPDELQARFQENVKLMRGDPDHNPYDDNPPGMNGDLPIDTVDGEFAAVPLPEQIKTRLHEQATQGIAQGATWKAEPTSQENVKKINAGLAILLPNAEQRHAVREYLLGHDSSSYTKGEIAALVGWLAMGKDADGATVPSAQAIADAKELIAFLCPPERPLFED